MWPAGMAVVSAVCWLAGVVGAVSLPPDDQYSPQHSLYRREVAQGPQRYRNWLTYQQDPTTTFSNKFYQVTNSNLSIIYNTSKT